MAAIAGVFWPKMLVATNTANSTRFSAITGGGTVIANACSYAATPAVTCPAACCACPAKVPIHDAYMVAAAAIHAEEAPSHGPVTSPVITDW